MRLHFKGDPVSWNPGLNTRFITARRDSPDGGYLLSFASSP